MARVDRKKSDWDVIEHVMRGLRATDQEDEVPRVHVVPGDWRGSWTLQAAEDPMPEHDGPPKEPEDRDPHHSHESDRRGEHKYPHKKDDDAERPSQRERDELVERLERRS